MAGKNRKKTASGGYMIPVPFALATVVASVFALGYLWLGVQSEELGRDLKKLEISLTDLQKQRLYEEARWANMKAPREIEKALSMHRLAMGWPSDAQIVRMSEADIVEALSETERPLRRPAPIQRVAMND